MGGSAGVELWPGAEQSRGLGSVRQQRERSDRPPAAVGDRPGRRVDFVFAGRGWPDGRDGSYRLSGDCRDNWSNGSSGRARCGWTVGRDGGDRACRPGGFRAGELQRNVQLDHELCEWRRGGVRRFHVHLARRGEPWEYPEFLPSLGFAGERGRDRAGWRAGGYWGDGAARAGGVRQPGGGGSYRQDGGDWSGRVARSGLPGLV